MLEAQARGMGDQLTERGFPSARALSLRQAALRGPWEGLSPEGGEHRGCGLRPLTPRLWCWLLRALASDLPGTSGSHLLGLECSPQGRQCGSLALLLLLRPSHTGRSHHPQCGWAKELLGVSPAGGRNEKGSLHTDVLGDFRRAAACLGLVSPPSSEGCADPDSIAKRQDSAHPARPLVPLPTPKLRQRHPPSPAREPLGGRVTHRCGSPALGLCSP